MAIAGLKNLCPPAQLYFVVSIIAVFIMFLQNFNGVNVYCLGSYSCDVTSVGAIFILKLVYIFFWTWILNLICRAGAEGIAWFLVLVPFILFFILLVLMMTPII